MQVKGSIEHSRFSGDRLILFEQPIKFGIVLRLNFLWTRGEVVGMLHPGERSPAFRPCPEREHHVGRIHGLGFFVVTRGAFGQYCRREGHPEVAILDGLVHAADGGGRIRPRQIWTGSPAPAPELRGAFRPGDDPALG